MKKILILLAAVMMTTNVMAQHEIGVVVGGVNGISHKYWFNDALALQTELAVGLTAAPTTLYLNGEKFISATNPQYDFTINPNIAYHYALPHDIQLYAGGGVNFGLVSDLNNTAPESIMGKFGINALVGAAYQYNKWVFALDFKPGYGHGFDKEPDFYLASFDWKLAFAVRYRL
jgi:hypothetical protein